jgi:hypothetical protein
MRTHLSIAAMALLLAFEVRADGPDEPWFNPSGGTWIPDAVVVSEMRVALDSSLRAALAAKPTAVRPPTRYWFQYLGRGSGTESVIEFFGHPFPVSKRAATVYFDVTIPENCVVYGRYYPVAKKIEELRVGLACPPRI